MIKRGYIILQIEKAKLLRNLNFFHCLILIIKRYYFCGRCKSVNILVVDDDRDIVESIAIFLANENYNILKAYDGLEAIEILNDNEVHLMILDIMMPKLDGIKTLVKLRESKNIPVILLSSKSEDTDKIFCLAAGADDYINSLRECEICLFETRLRKKCLRIFNLCNRKVP